MRIKIIFTSGANHIIECENMVRDNYQDKLSFYDDEGVLIGLVETKDLSAWFEIPTIEERSET